MLYLFFAALGLLVGVLLGASRLVLVWLSLFLSTFLTCLWLLLETPYISLKYFVLQEVFTSICLFSLLLGSSPVGFYWGLWLKLGLPPFQGWYLGLLYVLVDVSWFLTFSKIVPVCFLYGSLLFSYLFLAGLLFLVLLFLLGTVCLKGVLFFSRCLNFIWGFLVSFSNYFLALAWVGVYFSVNFLLLFSGGASLRGLFLLLGLPPSFVFFFKLLLVFLVVQSFLFFMGFLLSTLLLFFKYGVLFERQALLLSSFQEIVFGLVFLSIVLYFF